MKKNSIVTFIYLIVSVLVTLNIIAVTYRFWNLRFDVPALLNSDGWLGSAMIKGIYENGFIGAYFIDRMGAPLGTCNIIEMPMWDMISIIECSILCHVCSSYTVVQHLYYLLSYPLVCITMFILCIKLTNNNMLRLIMSVAFAITPYHFCRGYLHGSLSNYYIIPVIIYICILLIENEYCGLFPKAYKSSWMKKTVYFLAIFCIGISNIYYAFFALLCFTISILIKWINSGNWKCLIKEGLSLLLCVISVVIGILPNIVYTSLISNNQDILVRFASDTEYYSLKFIQLILPCMYNNVKFLHDITYEYNSNTYFLNESVYSSLGLIGTIGFLFACGYIVLIIVNKCSMVRSNKEVSTVSFFEMKNQCRIIYFSFIILTLFIYCSVGGLNVIVSYYITSVIRSLTRVSIVIACISLCIVTIILSEIVKHIDTKTKKIIFWCIVSLICLFVIYSEVDYKDADYRKETIEMDLVLKDFYSRVENDAYESANIFNIPYLPFPEGGKRGDMICYDQASGYLYTDTLRWSFGNMRGSNDFNKFASIDNCMSSRFIDLIKDNGFQGICIDTYGYEDRGLDIIAYYSDTLGLVPIVSGDGRLYYYNISAL